MRLCTRYLLPYIVGGIFSPSRWLSLYAASRPVCRFYDRIRRRRAPRVACCVPVAAPAQPAADGAVPLAGARLPAPNAPARCSPRRFGLLILASLCVAAAGYIINDYYDVKIDSINRPGRLVVGRVINRRHAMMAHLVLTGMGVLVAGSLSPLLGLVHLGSALLLWGYSARFKRLPLVGNLSIAMLTAALVLLPELQLRTGQHGRVGVCAGCFSAYGGARDY